MPSERLIQHRRRALVCQPTSLTKKILLSTSGDMNIAEEIQNFLEETGWSASRLAREAGLGGVQSLTRLLAGTRKSIHTKTLEKLWPFLYGEKHPTQATAKTKKRRRRKKR